MIREATIDDIPIIVEWGKAFFEYAIKDKGLQFDPTDFVKYCIEHMESPTGVILIAEDPAGVSLGMLSGIVDSNFMDSSQLIAEEKWWWVPSEHRGKKIGSALHKEFTQYGKRLGASVLVMTSIGAEDEQSVKDYYTNSGFKYLETQVIKGI